MQARVFIGSSSEGRKVAFAIQENLDSDAEVTVWSQGIFNLSNNYLYDLVQALDDFDFAILVYTPDDEAVIRGGRVSIPRDNVVFETGLFMGKLGRDRTFFVAPSRIENFHLLSDLSGISYGKYNDQRSDNNLKAALAPFCNSVRQKITTLNRRTQLSNINKIKIIVDCNPKLSPRQKKYYCKCIVCNDDTGEEEEKNVELRLEAGVVTVTLRDLEPTNLVQIKIFEESGNFYWESDYFNPLYSNRNLHQRPLI